MWITVQIRAKLYQVTYTIGRLCFCFVYRELADFIFPNQVKHVPDIFVIGTQESFSERAEWEITIQEVLGPSHLLLHSYYLGKMLYRFTKV